MDASCFPLQWKVSPGIVRGTEEETAATTDPGFARGIPETAEGGDGQAPFSEKSNSLAVKW